MVRKMEDDIKRYVNIWIDITEGVCEDVVRSRDEKRQRDVISTQSTEQRK